MRTPSWAEAKSDPLIPEGCECRDAVLAFPTMGTESLDSAERHLSEVERKRLERFERSRANRRGRKAPAVMPSRLARTSAFAPRKKGLVTDSTFQRLYIVRPHTVVHGCRGSRARAG
jgi:hypothetical protein